ncbi:permease [Rhodopseudomonas palustris]|uniref:Permease n=1 Tax=Rhodopseudomonas palustris TaxID=1076 RepID=A0A0D7ERN1_RHOPL|nr:permease [Rhodopseudomonas palustris]
MKDISRTLRITAIGLVLIIVLWGLRDILLLGFAAVLIACVLHGAGDALHRRSGLGEGWSLLAVVLTLLLGLGALLFWRGTVIADHVSQMTDQLSLQLQQLWQQMSGKGWTALLAQQLRSSVESAGKNLSGYVPGVASSVLGIGGSALVVVATALFLAISPRRYIDGALRLVPIGWRPRGREVMLEIGETLQLWFVGQFVDMVIVAVLVGVGLFLLGVPMAPTLALLAGLLNFVPYVGALAGAVPAILVALAQSPSLALWVALLFICVQTLEGNVIAPLIQRRTISLLPALTILSQTVLGTLFGAVGLVVATPLTAAMMTAVRMIYIEDLLERDTGAQDGR